MIKSYRTTLVFAEDYNEKVTKVFTSLDKPVVTLIGQENWSSHIHIDFGHSAIMIKVGALDRMETKDVSSMYEDNDF